MICDFCFVIIQRLVERIVVFWEVSVKYMLMEFIFYFQFEVYKRDFEVECVVREIEYGEKFWFYDDICQF